MTIHVLERVAPEPPPVRERGAAWPHRSRINVEWVALAAVVLLGAAIRSKGFTSLGLWRDDAWVAMTSRVPFSEAWHMGVTAPGFYLLERSWIMLHPESTWWDQIPPFVMGVACIPAIFGLCRYFRLGRWTCLFSALIVSLSPICVIYSTRLKEYQTDFLLACALLAVAEGVRRQPGLRRVAALAALSVASCCLSASTLIISAGVWTALIGLAVVERRPARRVVAGATAAAVASAVPSLVLYRHVSPSNKIGWKGFYVLHGSLGSAVSTTHFVLFNLYAKMIGISGSYGVEDFLLFWCMCALIILGACRSRAMAGPALVAVTAMLACAGGVIPLGAGRVDEVFYPGLLLLIGSGVQQLGRLCAHVVPEAGVRHGMAVFLGVILAGSLLIGSSTVDATYPATDTAGLATQIDHNLRPGDHVVVDELMRYPWALYEDHPLHLRFGVAWAAGFTVVSTQPVVFIAPSEVYEGGSRPVAWAAAMSHYTRLWFVETPPLQLSPLYDALRRDGWRPVTVLKATGCAAILLQRS